MVKDMTRKDQDNNTSKVQDTRVNKTRLVEGVEGDQEDL
jgi:hypothetical protein